MLAGIEGRGPHLDHALQSLEELAKAFPGHRGPTDALAWLRLAGNDSAAATVAFQNALAAGTRDPNLCLQFALKFRSSITDADYLAALRRAVEIEPDFPAAQRQLAIYAFNSHDYAEAVKRFHLVKKLDRSQAFTYYRALAVAAFQTGDVVEAKSAAARAQQYAVTPEDKGLADEMLKYVNGTKPGAGPAQLTATTLCAVLAGIIARE